MKASFEWDPDKELENISKHGVAFAEAQLAFLDKNRLFALDMAHSHSEQRFYCFGRVGERV